MTDGRVGGQETDGEHDARWPVALGGVTESVVATRGPNERWNFAALGLHAQEGEEKDSEGDDRAGGERSEDDDRANGERADTVRAYTWGRTRTRRNFHEHGAGYVQFACDPVLFVEATLGIHEHDEPVHPSADAWVRIAASSVGVETIEGTRREAWRLTPVESRVEARRVPTTRRGYAAVVEATVAASRLDVPAYDTDVLRDRLDYFESVVKRCGDDRDRAAMDRLNELTDSTR